MDTGSSEMMVSPFVVIVFYEAAGVGAGDKEVMGKRAIDNDGEDGIDEALGGWNRALARRRV